MLTLRATKWEYHADLNAPPARWSCQFIESGSTGFLPGESISRACENRVAIDVIIDGATERLLVGAVREWGGDERPDVVASTAEGIDLKASLLDFFPGSPVT